MKSPQAALGHNFTEIPEQKFFKKSDASEDHVYGNF